MGEAGLNPLERGTKVIWKWMGRSIHGVVVESFLEPVTREIKGKAIKRNGSPEKPAYLVMSDAGNQALKLQTELATASEVPKPEKSKPQPKMFQDE